VTVDDDSVSTRLWAAEIVLPPIFISLLLVDDVVVIGSGWWVGLQHLEAAARGAFP